ncbi:hypothetical protein J4558_06090 [Leptolyngbya sp. 15MV]|nr:hypothetical protein J4558_06090 [Leptolyngbya sp. 15MV]
MRVSVPSSDAVIPSLAPHYAPEIIAASDGFARAVYAHSRLPLRLFEAARIATATINGCTVCMAWRTARDAGGMGAAEGVAANGPEPDEAFYQAVLRGDDALLDPREAIAVRYARAMGEDPRGLAADEGLWRELKERLSDAEIVDLTYCIAAWMGLGRVTHVLGIDTACRLPAQQSA